MMPAHLSALTYAPSRSRSPRNTARQGSWLSHLWSDRADQVIRKAFMHADDPGLVLDVSRSVGKFWPVIMEKSNRRLIAGGADIEKVVTARNKQPPSVGAHIYPLKTGLSPIDLPQGGVDCIAGIGLWETGLKSMQRVALLKEFHRVTRESVIISACVNGNVASWSKDIRIAKQDHSAMSLWNQDLILGKETVEHEFYNSGFEIVNRLELLPLLSAWRVYVLRKTTTGST